MARPEFRTGTLCKRASKELMVVQTFERDFEGIVLNVPGQLQPIRFTKREVRVIGQLNTEMMLTHKDERVRAIGLQRWRCQHGVKDET